MTWRPDEATRRALETLIVFEEIHGEKRLIALLQQELARKEALRTVKQTRKLQDQIDLYSDALDFYANADNYRNSGKRPSAVAEDEGHKARRALASVGEQNGDAETEEATDE